MNQRQFNLLLHPLFLLSIFLLLLNDISLKYEFHNGLTGKLSDFTGLFAFAVFLMVIFPGSRWVVLIGTALFFIWWKSPMSESFIAFWNERMPVPIARVVDYWDLTALLVLPLAWQLTRSNYDPRIRYRRVFIPLSGGIALFAFCFTSPPRYGMYRSYPNEIEFYGEFKSSKTKQEILDKLRSGHIRFYQDSVSYIPMSTTEYYIRVTENDSIKWVPLPKPQDSVLYVRREESPFYIIPSYNLEGTELKEVKFTIYEKKKKTTVNVETFQSDKAASYSSETKKAYKKHFKKMFE